MTNTLRNKLHEYIDQMSDYQLRLVLGFIEKIFKLSD